MANTEAIQKLIELAEVGFRYLMLQATTEQAPIKRQSRAALDGATVARIRELVNGGMPARQVAEHLQISRKAVDKYKHQTPPAVSGIIRGKKGRLIAAEILRGGMSQRDICRKLKVSQSYVSAVSYLMDKAKASAQANGVNGAAEAEPGHA